MRNLSLLISPILCYNNQYMEYTVFQKEERNRGYEKLEEKITCGTVCDCHCNRYRGTGYDSGLCGTG